MFANTTSIQVLAKNIPKTDHPTLHKHADWLTDSTEYLTPQTLQ